MKRALAWTFGAIGGLALLLAIGVLLLHFLGKRALEKTRTEMEGRGETLEFAKLAPPPIPDDQNFALTPLLRPLLDYDFDWKTKQSVWRDPAGKKRAEKLKN